MLPLATWHVLSGWFDIITDILGIVGSSQLIKDIGKLESLSPAQVSASRLFFTAIMLAQVSLLAGNLLTQALLAAAMALRSGRGCRGAAAGFARGAVGMELAWHTWFKNRGSAAAPGAGDTRAALYYKMSELIWEAPQVVLAWTVLLSSLVLKYKAQGAAGSLLSLSVVLPLASAAFGLVSLSFGALDYVRLHPRSYWALPEPPAVLFLGLVDVGRGTWARSAAAGVCVCCSLLSRALLFMLLLFVFGIAGDPSQIDPASDPRRYYLPIVISLGSAYAFNLLLLLGMRSWLCLPAALISMFVNVPWVAARSDDPDAYRGRHSCWPAWIMEFVYSGCVAVLAFVAHAMPSNFVPTELSPGAFREEPMAAYASLVALALPVATALASLVTFAALTGWISERRRRAELAAAQVPTTLLCATDGTPACEQVTSLPESLRYKWCWCGPYLLSLYLDSDVSLGELFGAPNGALYGTAECKGPGGTPYVIHTYHP